MTIWCSGCKQWKPRAANAVRRAQSAGLNIYCGRVCSGLGRRKAPEICKTPKNPNWKALKSAYDAQRRVDKAEHIRAQKKAFYAIHGPLRRDKERETRKKNMPRHVEYCRRPEYRKYKQTYDLDYRAREFGEFAEAYKVLMEVEREIRSRITRTEIYQQNGLLNKAQRRKDDYARITNQPLRR